MISVDDITLVAGTRNAVSAADLLRTLKGIVAHRLPVRYVA
jgi:hypothetical protein